MARYTITIQSLVNLGFDFGLQDYPLSEKLLKVEPNYREKLNRKILEHFLDHEICCESPDRWKFYLNREMNEIMPYYNQIYDSTLEEFNPLWNVDITTIRTEELSGSVKQDTNSNSSMSTDNKTNTKFSETNTASNDSSNNTTLTSKSDTNTTGNTVKSDTPDTLVSLDSIVSSEYASEVSKNKSNDTVSKSDTSKETITVDSNSKTDSLTENTNKATESSNSKSNSAQSSKNSNVIKEESHGSSAGLPFSTAIKKWREIMINVDMMIIEKIQKDGLFMTIF